MIQRRLRLYQALVMFPDRLYPFKTNVGGEWVRGIRAYNAVVERRMRLYGRGHYGFALVAYRQLFHLAGSVFFLFIAAYISRSVLGSENALYGFFTAAVIFITYQEFYLHRRMYRQLWRKGVIDWIGWCAPIGAYLFFVLR